MNNKLPITRMSKFLSQDDFDLNIQVTYNGEIVNYLDIVKQSNLPIY